jgi:hypothetical protein
MSDTTREIQIVYGVRPVSASRLSETADGFERALHGSLDRARLAAGDTGPDRPGAQFDLEFAGLTELVRGAFDATAARLRDRAAGANLAERNHTNAEQAGVESAGRIRAALEGR